MEKPRAQEGNHSAHPAMGIALDVRPSAVPVTLAAAEAGSYGYGRVLQQRRGIFGLASR